jgi:transcriptional regulator with XRE-family HTH domain
MNISLANKLSSMRTAAGLSEAEAGAAAEISPETIKAWEHGEGSPSLAESISLSRVYGVDISKFAETADLSQGISLKKEQSVPLGTKQHGIKFTPYSEGYFRERIPDNFTDNEIYPKPQKQTVQNDAHSPYGVQSGYGAPTASAVGGWSDAPSYGNVGKVGNAQTAYKEPSKPGGINIEVVENRVNAAANNVATAMPEVTAVAEKIFTKTGEIIESAAEGVRRAMEGAAERNAAKPRKPTKQELREEAEQRKREAEANSRRVKAEYREYKKKQWRKSSLLYKVFPLLATAAFFLSIPIGAAHIGWLSFLLIPLYYGFHSAIRHRDMKRFPFPIIPLMLFLLTALLDGDPVWALWLFLTIPFYYILIDHYRGKHE